MEHLAEQYYNFAQEAITMTTTPITQPVNAPRAVYEHGQQPRPPIPAEVQAQAKSAALIICEQIADIVAIQTAKINKIESEIGILQDMIRDMASSLKQLPPAPPAAQSQSADAHKCVKHGVEMMRHEKNGQTWYSHQDGEKWCRGK
jgi:outer membrane murein-binding lipoprotein Lpp